MSSTTVETRLAQLESQVSKLQSELRELKTEAQKSWRRAVQRYAGDEDLREVLTDAIRLRDEDRKATGSERDESSRRAP